MLFENKLKRGMILNKFIKLHMCTLCFFPFLSGNKYCDIEYFYCGYKRDSVYTIFIFCSSKYQTKISITD